MAVFAKRDRFSMKELLYEKLEYIEGTGTQYINTDFIPNQNTKVVMDAQIVENVALSVRITYFGCRKMNAGIYYALMKANHTKDLLYWEYGTNYSITFAINWNTRRTIIADKGKITIDGQSEQYNTTSFEIGLPLYLLASNDDGIASYFAKGRIYSCKIYDNDVLIRDYIPVQMRKSNEIGLWDRVNGVFYGNAGSGAFIAGR